MKALQCLYLEVPSVIADDVKQKVIDALNEVKNCTIPIVSNSLPIRYCQQCGELLRRNKHKTWCGHYKQ